MDRLVSFTSLIVGDGDVDFRRSRDHATSRDSHIIIFVVVIVAVQASLTSPTRVAVIISHDANLDIAKTADIHIHPDE